MDNKLPTTVNGWSGSLIRAQQDQSGLFYRRNRYYDAGTGRFTQTDPIGLRGGGNLYGYAAGDPVNLSDPFGLCPICPAIGLVVAGIGALIEAASAAYDAWATFEAFMDDGFGAGMQSAGGFVLGMAIPGSGNAAIDGAKALRRAAMEEAAQRYPGKFVRPSENHHIVPKYLGGSKNGPTVPLNPAYHQLITNAFRDAWGYGQDVPTQSQLAQILQRVYARYPLPPGAW